jgi:asparagine synthetase B (glutamine-hydrolysing)
MCGIVGFSSLGRLKSLQATLPEALSSLTHRGPNDSGLFFDQKAGVGLVGYKFERVLV